MRTLGLVGGLGIEAGIYYYEHLAKAYAELGLALQFVLVHADVRKAIGHMMAGEREQLAQYLIALIRQLAGGGAKVAAIPAVTPHACIDAVEEASPIPIVNILRVLASALQQRGMHRIALFGTRFVIESDLYGALPRSIDVVRPNREEIERIDGLYRHFAVSGEGGAAERAEFTRIANELCRRERLDAVVLAGTDLSPLFQFQQPEFPYVDASDVHIAAILDAMGR